MADEELQLMHVGVNKKHTFPLWNERIMCEITLKH